MRDIEHVRAALQSVIGHVLDVGPIGAQKNAVRAARRGPADKRGEAVGPVRREALQLCRDLGRSYLELVVIVGSDAPLVERLSEITRTINESQESVSDWLDGSLTDEEIDSKLVDLDSEHSDAVVMFLNVAFAAVGWERPVDSSASSLSTQPG
jgi:hypothetical protein